MNRLVKHGESVPDNCGEKVRESTKDFRLLGTVEARIGGLAVDLGPARQRCVLVALLVDINHVVPVEQLLERVWVDHRPHRAHGTLYSYLSRLRTALRGAAGIAHQSGGYILTADPASVDLHRFRQLVGQARVANDVEHAANLFEQALELWRDEPFATLDTPWLNRMRAVLDAEQRAAVLDRNDVELGRGRHGELLAGLATKAAEHPLDERLIGQLMLARYRAGRQGEALEAYRDTRTALTAELGLEPGPELALLHQRILAADPELTVPAPAGTRTHTDSGAVPRQLPVDIVHFTGRERYLADLRTVLDRDEPAAVVITAIDGTAGVGKTALAVHFGHRVADRFPDGQLYLDLRGYARTSPMSAGEALGWMLRSLGLPPERIPTEEQEQAALYRSVLAGKRVLVMLDNARSAGQVRPLLPASPGCLVVVTSRTTLATLDGVSHLHLDVLPEPEALALLARLAGRDRVRREPDAATTLVSLCARLPLAVRIAGARLAARPTWTLASLVDRLTDEQRRLDELEVDDRAVRASFAVTYHALGTSPDPVDQRAARTFRLLGTLDWVEMSVPIAAALLDEPQPAAEAALERLLDAHLLDSTSPGRYDTHDLLRLYAREQAHAEPDRHDALLRALDCNIAAAEQAGLLLTSDPHSVIGDRVSAPRGGFTLSTSADVAGWIDTEQANLLAAANQAAMTPGAETLAVRLVAALARPFEGRGYWRDLVSLLELVIQTAHDLGDLPGEARVRTDLGYVYLRVGRTDDAIAIAHQAALDSRQVGDRRGESVCLRYIGHGLFELQRQDEAIARYQEALVICRDIDYRYGEAATLNALGLCYQRLHRLDEAIVCHRQALTIYGEIGSHQAESSALNNLAWAFHRSGDHGTAVAHFQEALIAARETGFRYAEAEILWGLGQTQHALGHNDEARTYWWHAITILQDIGALTIDEAEALRAQPIPDTPEIIQRNT